MSKFQNSVYAIASSMTTTLLHIHIHFHDFGISNTKHPNSLSSGTYGKPNPKLLKCMTVVPLQQYVSFRTSGFPTCRSARFLILGMAEKPNPKVPKWLTLFHNPTLFLHLLLGFYILGLPDPGCNNSLPLQLPISEIPKYQTPKHQSSTPNWDQWLIASPDPTTYDLSRFHGSRVPNSYPLYIPVAEMTKSSFREFPRNLDRFPRILPLDGHDTFKISWVKSPNSCPLYLPVPEILK
jgi:hypothetical protein